jgi:uncharacterized coiled-coil protein SlyX
MDPEARLQETEIKLAFLEKELDEYKDAVQGLHARLDQMEKTLKEWQEAPAAGEPAGADGDQPAEA